jgi:hypothetical protein
VKCLTMFGYAAIAGNGHIVVYTDSKALLSEMAGLLHEPDRALQRSSEMFDADQISLFRMSSVAATTESDRASENPNPPLDQELQHRSESGVEQKIRARSVEAIDVEKVMPILADAEMGDFISGSVSRRYWRSS